MSTAKWPLDFQIQASAKVEEDSQKETSEKQEYWSHTLYRGPDDKKVEVLYSATKEGCEEIAKQFLDEPVLGFDMEWEIWKQDRLQEQISLVQFASESRIGLFHLALIPGTKPDDLVAPSLKKIIESSTITKVGVNIMGADGKRLVEKFGMKPKRMFELSYLHRLVTDGPHSPSLVKTKLCALATQVKYHLGLPLHKGSDRTSKWSRRLNQSQQHYAAADAYAGYMLYHCMNNKRLALDPSPPLPLHADDYLPFRPCKHGSVRLESTEEGKAFTTPEEFWPPPETETTEPVPEGADGQGETTTDAQPSVPAKAKRAKKPKADEDPLDTTAQLLFDKLKACRLDLANQANLPAYRIASDATLRDLARRRPMDNTALLEVKGVGQFTADKYGAHWLKITLEFANGHDCEMNGEIQEAALPPNLSEKFDSFISNQPMMKNGLPIEPPSELRMGIPSADPEPSASISHQPSTPIRNPRRRPPPFEEDALSSSPAFATPAQLRTGLSFQMAHLNTTTPAPDQTDNEDKDQDPEDIFAVEYHTSDFSSPNFDSSPSPRPTPAPSSHHSPPLNLKHARLASPCPARTPQIQSHPHPPNSHTLSPPSKRFHSRMTALGRLVATTLGQPLEKIVTASTLRQLVESRPKTLEELYLVPGIGSFVNACKQANRDLMEVVAKHAPGRK